MFQKMRKVCRSEEKICRPPSRGSGAVRCEKRTQRGGREIVQSRQKIQVQKDRNPNAGNAVRNRAGA